MTDDAAHHLEAGTVFDEDMAVAHLLLQRVGVVAPSPTLHRLAGGRNNRVFRVVAGNRSFLLKRYFTHASDPRDRLGAEWRFATLLWDAEMRCQPQPIAVDTDHGAALFEWIEGRPVTSEDVYGARLDAAMRFVVSIQSLCATAKANDIAAASEACFSMDEHAALIGRRVDRLHDMKVTSALHQQVRDWVRSVLSARWDEQLRGLAGHCRELGVDPTVTLPQEHRCLSPSDFGFHNALIRDGKLVFFDFEYAGWDDPAKLVCDFFCQPRVPAPLEGFDRFAKPLISSLLGPSTSVADIERERLRFHLLLPLYQIKWCCILLNEFLPVGNARRWHAGDRPTADHLKKQFEQARHMLQRLPKIAA